jgi:homoserine kinase
MTVRAVVRVPASTSNLGAGFDCVGVAVDRWLTVTTVIEPNATEELRLHRAGTLHGLPASTDHDRIVAAFRAACESAGRAVPHGVAIRANSDIPVGRGLGSSAAAVVAGAAAANVLLRLGFDDQRLVELCAALEGHPDNVVPAIHGGAVLAVPGPAANGESESVRELVTAPIELHPDLALALAVPDFEVETVYMRAALPGAVPHAIATRAAALGAALVAGLTSGHPGLLELALDDVLHVPYRRELVPGYDSVTQAARDAGAFGATLSGSGSSICAIAPLTAVQDVAGAMVAAWRAVGIVAESITGETPAAGYSATVRRELDDDTGAAVSAAVHTTN